MKNNKRGDVLIGLLIGLAVGAAMLFVNSGETAQRMADSTGRDTSQWDVIANEPGKSTMTILAPAAAGAGIGFVLEEAFGGKDKGGSSQDNNIRVNTEGNVNITVIGNQDNDTRMDTRTDTRTETRTNQ
jgi:hypothetical protein